MCHLNICIKTKDYDCMAEFMHVCANSYSHNDDGDGVYISSINKVVKSLGKLNLLPYWSMIKASEFVIGHQRFSTSGFTEENTQPFENDRFVFCHNGVVNGGSHQGKSDSAEWFDKFMSNFEREKSVKRAVETTLDSTSGSYSMFLYDKKLKTGFYWKNSGTSIVVVSLDNGSIFITTTEENLKYFGDKIKTRYKIEDGKLYRFQVNGRAKIADMGKLKLKVEPTSWQKSVYGSGGYLDSFQSDLKGDKADIVDDDYYLGN
jgi:glutamine phosphoribosylpyrophosphate amidotransferase